MLIFFPQALICSLNHQKLSTTVLINTRSHSQSLGEKVGRCSSSTQHLGTPLPHRTDPYSTSTHPLRAAGSAGTKDAPDETTPCLTGRLQPPRKAVCFCDILYPHVFLFALEHSTMNAWVYKLNLHCFNLNCKISSVSPTTLLSICCVHTKKGLKTLLIPDCAQKLQHTSYIRI